jgi:dihydrofolate reductase
VFRRKDRAAGPCWQIEPPHRSGVEHAAQVRGASTTLTDPQWADTTVLSGDVAAAVGELKAKPGGELQVHGSGNLVRWLLDNQLVDEITLLTYPVVVGQGTRLFPVTGPDTALELVDSQSTPKGVSIQVYRPTGRPQYATATADLKHVT